MKSSTWADNARQTILDFVERSTRFSPRNFELNAACELEVNFQVEVSHRVICQSHLTTLLGHSSPGPHDILARDSSDLSNKIDAILDEALEAPAIRGNLKATVARNGFGKYKEAYSLGNYHRRLLRTYSCHTCNASGKVRCNICIGAGRTRCISCSGTGEVRKYEYNYAHKRNDLVTVRCHLCQSGRVNCLTCNCTGQISCPACGGASVLTDVVTFEYVVTPKYHPVLAGITDVDAIAALSAERDWSEIGHSQAELIATEVMSDPALLNVKEVASFKAPLFSAQVSIEKHMSRVVVFGTQCAITNAGGLVEVLVNDDLNMLEADPNQRALRTFMQSEVHQKLVESVSKLASNYDAEKTADMLAKALSPAYIDKSVKALDVGTQKIVKGWDTAFNVIALFIFAYLGYFMVQEKHFVLAIFIAGGLYLIGLVLSFIACRVHLSMLGGAQLSRFAKRRGRTVSKEYEASV